MSIRDLIQLALLFFILTIFIAGLMIGRTPGYLGKKIEAREVKYAMLAMIIPALLTLGFTAIGDDDSDACARWFDGIEKAAGSKRGRFSIVRTHFHWAIDSHDFASRCADIFPRYRAWSDCGAFRDGSVFSRFLEVFDAVL